MFTLESFCNSIWNTSYSSVINQISKDDYREFEIPKKDGFRIIHYLDQDSELSKLQQALLKNYLEKQVVPICAKGFIKGESYKTYLSPHVGSKFYLRIDIEAFFPSITEPQIKNGISTFLSCNTKEDKALILDLVSEIVSLNGTLPQGACTSPAVSNLVFARLDQRIQKYCQVFDINYTRYADDLLFSSRTFDLCQKKWFLRKIRYILHSQEFELNYSKTKYGLEEISLNGYVVSRKGIRLSRNRLSDIRRIVSLSRNKHSVFNSNKDEFLAIINSARLKYRCLEKYPFNTQFSFIQYLCGYRAFLISWIDNMSPAKQFQKNLLALISRIESEVLFLTNNSCT